MAGGRAGGCSPTQMVMMGTAMKMGVVKALMT